MLNVISYLFKMLHKLTANREVIDRTLDKIAIVRSSAMRKLDCK